MVIFPEIQYRNWAKIKNLQNLMPESRDMTILGEWF